MKSAAKSARTLKGRAFMVLGYAAIALQAFNLYLFIGMIAN